MPVTSADLPERPPKRSRWLRLLWLPPLLLVIMFSASLFRPLHLTAGHHHLQIGAVESGFGIGSRVSAPDAYFDLHLGTRVFYAVGWTTPSTVASVEAMVRREVPPGSTPSQVHQWLEAKDFRYDYYTGAQLGEPFGALTAGAFDYPIAFPGNRLRSGIYLRFEYDVQQRLTDVSVQESWSVAP